MHALRNLLPVAHHGAVELLMLFLQAWARSCSHRLFVDAVEPFHFRKPKISDSLNDSPQEREWRLLMLALLRALSIERLPALQARLPVHPPLLPIPVFYSQQIQTSCSELQWLIGGH